MKSYYFKAWTVNRLLKKREIPALTDHHYGHAMMVVLFLVGRSPTAGIIRHLVSARLLR